MGYLDKEGLSRFWEKARAYIDAHFLPLSGGTLTGVLNLNGNNLFNAGSLFLKADAYGHTDWEPPNIDFYDDGSSSCFEFMSHGGYQKLAIAAPVKDIHAANKQYVDDLVSSTKEALEAEIEAAVGTIEIALSEV